MKVNYTVTAVLPESSELVVQYSCADDPTLPVMMNNIRVPVTESGEIVSEEQLHQHLTDMAPVEYYADLMKVKVPQPELDALVGFVGIAEREPVQLNNPLTENWE